MDLVENWHGDDNTGHPILPNPLVGNVVLERELGDLRRDRVGELHGTTWGSVRHSYGFGLKGNKLLCNVANSDIEV